MERSSGRIFAAEADIGCLHKFRRFGTPEEKERVRQILLENRVYFSRPSELHAMDSNELRPRVVFRRAMSDTETRELLIQAAKLVWKRNNVPPEKQEQWLKRLQTERIEVLEDEAMTKAHIRLENYWVFSMCASRDYFSMWDEYGDKRHGLCIHFRVNVGAPFGFAQQVDYLVPPLPPLLIPFGEMTDMEVGRIATLTKAKSFEHEREFRLIKYPQTTFEDFGIRFDGQFAHFSDQEVIAISIGDQMPAEDIEMLRSMVAARRIQIPIHIAKR
jgi:hypothetical protein